MYTSPPTSPHILRALLCAGLLAISSPALAQGEDEDARFEQALAQAKEAFVANNFDEAIAKLQEANRLRPDARLIYNIARSYEKKGDCVRTLAYLKAFTTIKDAPAELVKEANRDLKKNRKACRDFSDDLSGRVTIETTPAGASITLDGSPVGRAPFETIALAPGAHELVLSLEGHASLSTTLVIGAGQLEKREAYTLKRVEVKSTPDPSPDPGPAITTVDEPDEPLIRAKPDDGPGLNIPAIAIAGVGAVVLGVGLYHDLSKIPGLDEQRRAQDITPERYDTLTEERQSAANIALASYVIGGLMVAGGVGWIVYDIVSAKPSDTSSPSVRLVPLIAPDQAGLGLSGRF